MLYVVAEFKFFPLEGRRLKNYQKGLASANAAATKGNKYGDLASMLMSTGGAGTPVPLWRNKRAVGLAYEGGKNLSPMESLMLKDRRNLPFLPVRKVDLDVVGDPRFKGQALPALMEHVKDNPNTFYTGAPASKQHERVYRYGAKKNNIKNLNILESFDE